MGTTVPVLAALLLAAPAATGQNPAVITTFAGSVGSGPAESVGFGPLGIVHRGNELIIADLAWDVLRAVDLGTGQARVIAGTGFEGGGGDGGVATEMTLKNPTSVAVDGAGVVYFSEPDLHRIRRLGTDGRISTLAGTGAAGYSGDGGPATAAMFNHPIEIAADGAGNVYVSDAWNNRVRRIAQNGTVTTVAGTGEQGFSGDGGPATLARFDTPGGIAADAAGNLFVTDQQFFRRVRRIDPLGNVTTVAGGGSSPDGTSGPATSINMDIARDVESDGAGGFYVSGTYSVTHVNAQGWAERVAGNGDWPDRRGEPNGDGGPATAAQIQVAEGLAHSTSGDLYIADSGNARIRKVTPNGTITTIAGTSSAWMGGDGGPATRGQLESPGFLRFDTAGNLLFGDNSFVRRVNRDGTLATLVGHPHRSPCPFDGAAPRAVDACAGAADAAPDGRLFFSQPQGFRVWTVGLDGVIHPFAGTGQRGTGGEGQAALDTPLDWPLEIEIGPAGDVFFLEYGGTNGSRLRRVDATGAITTVAGGGTNGGEGIPARDAVLVATSFTLAPDGSIYLVEMDLHRVRKVGPDGRIRTVAGTGRAGRGPEGVPALLSALNDPRAVAAASDGGFYLSDSRNHRVRRVASDGTITTVAGRGTAGFSGDGGAATDAELNYPLGLAVDSGGVLFVADLGNRRIRRIAAGSPAGGGNSGGSTTGAGGGTGPSGGTPPPGTTEPARSGYWMLDAGGSVYAFGSAAHHGNARFGTSAADIEPTPSGRGYWLLESAGSVRPSGDASALSGLVALGAGERATSLSATPSGQGYWIFTTTGRSLPFGDAGFFGDMSGRRLNAPVLDSVATPSGRGYYMVASDGGIFTFGDAGFHGSMGGRRLNAPVQSLVPDADGTGYWLVASDGGIFAFDAPFKGSMGGVPLNRPVTGMVRYGDGYLMVGEDGGLFNFSNRPFAGSLGANPPANPIVSVAGLDH